MVQRQIDKVVATQLLEAAKSVLEHVSHWMIELNESGREPPPGLSQVYGKARRIRDYLHRGVAAYGRTVTLDFTEEDENILASCIVHHLGLIDLQLKNEEGTGTDTSWLEEKRKNLSAAAVDFANEPVERIPSRDNVELTTPTVRAVTSAIAQKTLRIPGDDSPPTQESGPPRSGWPPAASSGGPAPGYSPPARGTFPPSSTGYGAPAPAYPAEQHAAPHPAPGYAPQPAHAVPPSGYGAPAPAPAAAPAPGPGQITHGYGYADMTGGVTPGQPRPGPAHPAPASAPSFVDPNRIADPRLRTMVAMDVRAFDRTMAAEQYRLAMIHLASVFEAVIVDYAIPRQKNLGIKGPPETWRIEQVLDRALGDRLTSMDRPYLLQFVAARHLVRPAIQLHSPMVVTRASLEKSVDFGRRVLVELGYAGSAQPLSGGYGGQSPMPGDQPGAPGQQVWDSNTQYP